MCEELVSIITPAYCCANVLDETIQSVLAQTYTNWEMLIADDCSPDETRDIIARWTNIDHRIKYIKTDFNGGPSEARNAALERAKGRWIAFLDSDDLWLPLKLQHSIDFARSLDASFIFTGFRRIKTSEEEPSRYISVPKTMNYRQLLGNTAIATSTVMLDKSRVGKIHMRKTYYDDFDCWLQLLKKGIVAHGLDEDLMRYRVMENSISRNKFKSCLKVWQTYRDLQGIGFLMSTWYFIQYSIRGVFKYL